MLPSVVVRSQALPLAVIEIWEIWVWDNDKAHAGWLCDRSLIRCRLYLTCLHCHPDIAFAAMEIWAKTGSSREKVHSEIEPKQRQWAATNLGYIIERYSCSYSASSLSKSAKSLALVLSLSTQRSGKYARISLPNHNQFGILTVTCRDFLQRTSPRSPLHVGYCC